MPRSADERWESARNTAYQELGRRHYRWFVGAAILRRVVAPIAALVGAGLGVGALVRSCSFAAPREPAPSAGAATSVWPWLLLAGLAASIAVVLAYGWWHPQRGRAVPALLSVLVLCAVALLLWLR